MGLCLGWGLGGDLWRTGAFSFDELHIDGSEDYWVLFGLSKAFWLRILDLLSQDSGVMF